jgi:hypothetical protein
MRGNAALIGRLERVGRGREAAARGGDRGGAGPGEAEDGGEERKVKGAADRWAGSSAKERKRKKRWQSWAATGEGLMGCWATGPKGKRDKFLIFFLFLFQTLFKTTF